MASSSMLLSADLLDASSPSLLSPTYNHENTGRNEEQKEGESVIISGQLSLGVVIKCPSLSCIRAVKPKKTFLFQLPVLRYEAKLCDL